MRLLLMHLHDGRDAGPHDEAAMLVPGGERTAFMVPLDALEDVVSMFAGALDGQPVQRCPSCEEPIAVPGPWNGGSCAV